MESPLLTCSWSTLTSKPMMATEPIASDGMLAVNVPPAGVAGSVTVPLGHATPSISQVEEEATKRVLSGMSSERNTLSAGADPPGLASVILYRMMSSGSRGAPSTSVDTLMIDRSGRFRLTGAES